MIPGRALAMESSALPAIAFFRPSEFDESAGAPLRTLDKTGSSVQLLPSPQQRLQTSRGPLGAVPAVQPGGLEFARSKRNHASRAAPSPSQSPRLPVGGQTTSHAQMGHFSRSQPHCLQGASTQLDAACPEPGERTPTLWANLCYDATDASLRSGQFHRLPTTSREHHRVFLDQF